MPGRSPMRRRLVATSVLTTLLALAAGDVAQAAPPSNDSFAQRSTIALIPSTDSRDTTEATLEAGEQQPQGGDCLDFQITGTVWYQYTPSATVELQADTFASTFDTMLAVWTGGALGSLSPVGCSDQAAGGDQSRVIFTAAAGTTYLFQVGGWEGDSGQLFFNLGPAPPLGAISGTVHADGGGPLSGICVDVFDEITGEEASTVTDGAGNYRITGLPGGSYVVAFYDWCDDSTDYVEEYYDDSPTYDGAEAVLLTPPSESSGIDAGLAVGGSFSGRVTDANTGQPVEGVCVEVAGSDEASFGFALTGPDGRYGAGGLRSGSYQVGFYDCDGERYREEWFDNKGTYEEADAIGLTAPGSTTIDAALIPSSGPISKEIVLRARPKRVERGDRVRLTATVSPCAGDPGERVEFFRGRRKLDAETTGRTCSAMTTVRAKRTGTYHAVSPADGDQLQGASRPVKVKVRGG